MFISLVSCEQESPEQYWQKGNLHTHSFWSDGDDFPEMIIQWYKDNNYQFIALSDHNTIASRDYWYKLKKISQIIDNSVKKVLYKGFRTEDIMDKKSKKVGTNDMGDLIIKEITKNF